MLVVCREDNSSPCQLSHADRADPSKRPTFSYQGCDGIEGARSVGFGPEDVA